MQRIDKLPARLSVCHGTDLRRSIWRNQSNCGRSPMDGKTGSLAENYLALEDAALLDQCDVDCYRSRGPGGQKRNKTSSAVRLRHRPTRLAAIATEDRSQHVNKARAIRRLREAIALHIRRDVDEASYAPSELLRASISADGRFLVGRRDPRRCLAVSEILDLMAACNVATSRAAKCLGLSTGQLIKLLRADRKLWAQVNRMRAAVGAKPLR